MSGIHTAPLLHLEPTYREFSVEGISLYRFVDDEIAEGWNSQSILRAVEKYKPMIYLTHSITIKDVSPNECWKTLATMHVGQNYLQWHPADHRWFRLLRGDGKQIGSKLRFREEIGGKALIMSIEVTAAKPDNYIEYGVAFPLSLLHLGKQRFQFEQKGDATVFISDLIVGYKVPLAAQVGDWLIRKLFDLEAIRKHIEEEGNYFCEMVTGNKQS